MLEQIVIIILTALVILLLVLLMLRRRKTPAVSDLDNRIVNDINDSFLKNIKGESIPNIAGTVSEILIKHLNCDRIAFLKRKRALLELNYFHGINRFNRSDFQITLNPTILKKLYLRHRLAPLSQLTKIIDEDRVKFFESFGFKFYFPVFIRGHLYGLYLIKTDLPGDSAILKMVFSTLVFNLSTAYHLNWQDNKIKQQTQTVTAADSARPAGPDADRPDRNPPKEILLANHEYSRYLKLKNCRQLIPELVKKLHENGDFNALGLFARSGQPEREIISSARNIEKETENLIIDNYDNLLKSLGRRSISESPGNAADEPTRRIVDKLKKHGLTDLATINWGHREKALVVYRAARAEPEIKNRLKEFESLAGPLIDNIIRFEKAEELSFTDGLTGMYNFRYLIKRLSEELPRAKRYERNLALLLFDVDDLKMVNDRHGHLAGDALIKACGRSLVDSVRSNDIVSRYGGDEFCVIMPDTSREDVVQFMDRMVKKSIAARARLEWANRRIEYSVSMGGAVYPEDARTVDGLIHAADLALLRAKQEGRNRARIYVPEMAAGTKNMENDKP
jgi:diguanylate cyclase (GGDEF)-like protein